MIKFRVRDIKTLEIVAYEIFNMTFGWHHILKSDIDKFGGDTPVYNGILSNVNNLIREQYIGINSKSNLEIYEGDIILYQNEYKRLNIHKVFRTSGGFSININNEDFNKDIENILFYDSCANIQTKGYLKNFEIVSNIYENKTIDILIRKYKLYNIIYNERKINMF